MAKNEYFYDATSLSIPVGTGILSGDPVRLNSLNGVAQTDAGVATALGVITSGNAVGWASITTKGAHRVSVTVSAARGIGYPIYAVVSGSNTLATLSDVATGKLFGVLLEPIAAAGTFVRAVKLAATSI